MDNSEAGEKDDFEPQVDGLTLSTDSERPTHRSASDATVVHNEPFDTDAEKDEHTEALIQAAARDIIEKIEQDAYDKKHGKQPSDVNYTEDDLTDSSYTEGSGLTFDQETELTYEDETEMDCEGEETAYEEEAGDNGDDGSASSHHEDDVFSHGRTPSGGSNNSSDAQNTDEEARYRLTKEIAEEVERQQAAHQAAQLGAEYEEESQEEGFFDQSCDENDTPMVSRVPSCTTTTSAHHSLVPNVYLNPSGFRSPGSIRALQMSSPAPSVFSGGSPMSRKRPTSSHRLGAPQKNSPLRTTKITPRFAPKEDALVLLHVTVLPLRWPHGELIENAPNDVLSKELLAVKQSWKVLKDKLGDTVIERGVLIAHPQDSFETLHERLCAALELPNRPRAKILDCGHYLGPTALLVHADSDSSDSDSSDDEDMDDDDFKDPPESTWCDVCEKDVHFGKVNKLNRLPRKKSFKVKVYASNGLMGSGAWAASWRQMEKVDVEIEPAVEPGFNMEIGELFDMAMATRQQQEAVYEDVESPQIVIEEPMEPPVLTQQEPVTPAPTYLEATRPSTAVTVNQEPAYMEARRFESSPPAAPSIRMFSPEPSAQPVIAIPAETKIRHLEDEVRRIEIEEQRHREVYGNEQKQPPSRSPSRQQHYQEQPPYHRSRSSSSRMSSRSSTRRQPKPHVNEDSFLELLLAAARVLLSDTKNLVIGFLAMLVIVFALRSGGGTTGMVAMNGVASVAQPIYETAFQRQEAAMQRLQMEDVAKMRMQADAMVQRPAAAYQAPHAAVVEDVQRVQHVVVHDSQVPVYAQQAPLPQVVPVQQAPLAPVVHDSQIPVFSAQQAPDAPAIPVQQAPPAPAVQAEFAIPTPPASIREAAVAV